MPLIQMLPTDDLKSFTDRYRLLLRTGFKYTAKIKYKCKNNNI